VSSDDPFLKMIQSKQAGKDSVAKDALLFAKSEANTPSRRDFVRSCQEQFDRKGSLSQKQINALLGFDGSDEFERYGNGLSQDDEYWKD